VLPPGPRDGVLRQTVALHRDPLAFLRAGQVEFGDVFTIRLLTARPVVVAAENKQKSKGRISPSGDGKTTTK